MLLPEDIGQVGTKNPQCLAVRGDGIFLASLTPPAPPRAFVLYPGPCPSPPPPFVARRGTQIPHKMMDSNDPRRKRARDRQRSIERIRQKKGMWVQAAAQA